MSEELNQRDLEYNPEKIGKYDFRNIGSTSLLQLKKAGIIKDKPYTGFEKRKPDALISIPEVIKAKDKITLGIVENKSTSQFKTEKQKEDTLRQGLDVAQVLEAKFLVLTDMVDTIWVNAHNGEKILDEKGRIIKMPFDPKNPDLEKLIEKIVDSVDANNSQLREPRLKDPTKLAKSIWQDLWMAAGATPENCLYSFVELFIFKYLSDLGVLKFPLNYKHLMDIYNTNGDAEATLDHYARIIRVEIKKLFKKSDKDNTTIINGTIFVSKDEEAVKGYGTVFIKILKKFGDEKEGGGELKNIDRDFKSKLFETFLKESISKKNWGQYFTPLKVVRAIAKMAQSDIKPNITMCDPACGVGKFLLEPLLINNEIEDFFPVEKGVLQPKIKLIGIDKGFDKEEQKTIILAKANMLIYLSDQIRKNAGITDQFAKVFNDTFELKTKNILGTLRDTSYEGKIDLILTNPPYVTTGSSNLKEEISKVQELKDFYKINAMGVEGLFMEWIIRSLKSGGKAFIVIPSGIFNRQNDKNLRQFIVDECIIDGIISLPPKTFFTTTQKTYILCITKKKNKAERQTDPVFTYLVSEIGESRDIYRFDIDQNDLEEATHQFNLFKGSKKYYKTVNKRCKIELIERFISSIEDTNGWIIDKWWDKESLVEFGEKKEEDIITISEFRNEIIQLSDELDNLSSDISNISDNLLNISFKDFVIDDVFYVIKGNSKYTKSYINENKGNFPVYSSQTTNEGIIGLINSFDFDGEALTWTTDGTYVGTVFYRNCKFSMTTHCGALILKPEWKHKIYLPYIGKILNSIFPDKKVGENSNKRLGIKNVKNISFKLPVDETGEILFEIQKNRFHEFKNIEDLKNDIIQKMQKLKSAKIKF